MPTAMYFDPVKNFDDLPNSAVIRVPTVIAVLGISRATWWNGVRDGIYPPALQIGPRSVGWRVSDIRAILASYSVKKEKDTNSVKAHVAFMENTAARKEAQS